MLLKIGWDAINFLDQYSEYMPLIGLVVIPLVAAAGILHLACRSQETSLKDLMIQMTANLNSVVVIRAMGWGCFALTMAVMIYPSWYCEYHRYDGRGVFFGTEPVRRSAAWSPPVCQYPDSDKPLYGQPRIHLDTTILPVLILAGFGVGFLCLAAQLSRHPRS